MIGLAVVLGMLVQSVADDADKAAAKSAICHVPPGNPAHAHTLNLPEAALAAHLGHGDVAGECAATAEGAGPEAARDATAPRRRRVKTAVCHVPADDPANARTLRLPAPAVRAHLRHGDTEGPCPGDATSDARKPDTQR